MQFDLQNGTFVMHLRILTNLFSFLCTLFKVCYYSLLIKCCINCLPASFGAFFRVEACDNLK